jgi:cytochrome c oxidase accessory protein FixG
MWLTVALLTGLTFVGYFTPIRDLTLDLARFDANAWAAFWVAFFTAATYTNAGWMREQVCIYMCPYARFQSAMFDPDTLIVSYDAGRGEPRGSRKRGSNPEDLGDCIDCTLCVQVCPTGIDIRRGLQYECIGCAHCIDACNQVMDRMGYDPGLIRYTTERELAGGNSHWLRPRTIGYGVALLIIAAAFGYGLITRKPFEVDVLRERGALYEELADGRIGNQYQLRLLNKTQRSVELIVSTSSTPPTTPSVTGAVALEPGEMLDLPLTLSADGSGSGSANIPVLVRACEARTGRCDTEQTRFLRPGP